MISSCPAPVGKPATISRDASTGPWRRPDYASGASMNDNTAAARAGEVQML